MGGDFVLGEAAFGSTRLPLPNPSITYLDKTVEHTVDYNPVAPLWVVLTPHTGGSILCLWRNPTVINAGTQGGGADGF